MCSINNYLYHYLWLIGVPENNYIVQATTVPDKFESIPVTSSTNLQQQHTYVLINYSSTLRNEKKVE